jgi:hypothetical protein
MSTDEVDKLLSAEVSDDEVAYRLGEKLFPEEEVMRSEKQPLIKKTFAWIDSNTATICKLVCNDPKVRVAAEKHELKVELVYLLSELLKPEFSALDAAAHGLLAVVLVRYGVKVWCHSVWYKE